MGWTEERVELLRTLRADGLSAGQIAERLGVTRNTIIGKVHRLGLAGRSGAQYRSAAHGLPRGPRRAYVRQPRAPTTPCPAVRAQSAEMPRVARSRVNPPLAVSTVIDLNRAPLGILDIEDDECRWPGRSAWCRASVCENSCAESLPRNLFRVLAGRGRQTLQNASLTRSQAR